MKYIQTFLFTMVLHWAFPDTIRPEVGQPCPDFALTRVTYYSKSEVTLSDFRGKWLILDFWSSTCASCIGSFPKISRLQRAFDGRIQFLLIGQNDGKYNRNIESMFEKLRKKQDLYITSAYDSVLAVRWGVRSVPHIIMVDPFGIVRHVTDGRDMTIEKLDQMLDGRSVTFYPKRSEGLSRDVVISNVGNRFGPNEEAIYHSVLTKWKGEKQDGGFDIGHYADIINNEANAAKPYRLVMVHLNWLYNMAYHGQYYLKSPRSSLYGKVFHYPILEMKDTNRFEFSFAADVGKGLYNYSLKLPSPQTKESVMRLMQQDLKRAFGYDAFVEVRDVPVWKLVAGQRVATKLKTKEGIVVKPSAGGSTAAGFTGQNIPMDECFFTLISYLVDKTRFPFANATGITGNVDFTISADMTDIEDVKRQLKRQGMDLVLGKQKMQVLVIRDPDPFNPTGEVGWLPAAGRITNSAPTHRGK